MQTIIQSIAVIFFFALAVWYLYRRYKGIVDPNPVSCNCNGCSSCSMQPKTTSKKERFDETNR